MSFLGSLLPGLGSGLSLIPGLDSSYANFGQGLLNGFASYLQEDSSRAWQIEQAEAQRNWASAEAEKSRQFNAAEAQKAREWNSIGQQIDRAREAGVNPSAAIGASGMNTPTAATSSVPTGSSALEAGVPSGILNLEQLSRALLASHQAAKVEKETGRYDEQIDALVGKLRSDAALASVQKDGQDFINQVNRIFGKSEKAVQILETYNRALQAAAAGRASDAEAEVKKMEKELLNTKNEKEKVELAQWPSHVRATIKVLESEANERNASAREHDAGAALKLEQRDTQKYETSIKKIESEKSEATKAQQIDALLAQLSKETAVAQNEQLRSDIQAFRDSLNDPRKKDKLRQNVDASLDWLRQKFGLGVSTSISIK